MSMFQQIIDFLYRHPKSRLKTYRRFGGYFSYLAMLNGSKQMEKASHNLPAVTSYNDGLPVYFLTGKKYLYQTLFCIQSLAKVSDAKFQFTLVDDGSFDTDLINRIKKQLPGSIIITSDIITQNLLNYLPENLYPNLHRKRREYPHIKKLTDVHTIKADDWKLVLDSDMLFWQTPADIINWLQQPAKPIHMVDCVESYGYSNTLMESLTGQKIPPLLNVGAIGLSSSNISWAKFDKWIEELEQQEGTSYYLEQALTAMLIGGVPTTVLNPSRYVVNPTGMGEPNVALHHYVDLSKKMYLKKAWKAIIS